MQQADVQCTLGTYKSENKENLYNLGTSAMRGNTLCSLSVFPILCISYSSVLLIRFQEAEKKLKLGGGVWKAIS